jgi:lipid-A-disaccharide synthase-like uncharacterized protein
MTLRLSKILKTVNKYLTCVNAFLFGLGTFQVLDLEKIKEKKIPLYWNILLLIAVLVLVFAMTYGEYRRVEGF